MIERQNHYLETDPEANTIPLPTVRPEGAFGPNNYAPNSGQTATAPLDIVTPGPEASGHSEEDSEEGDDGQAPRKWRRKAAAGMMAVAAIGVGVRYAPVEVMVVEGVLGNSTKQEQRMQERLWYGGLGIRDVKVHCTDQKELDNTARNINSNARPNEVRTFVVPYVLDQIWLAKGSCDAIDAYVNDRRHEATATRIRAILELAHGYSQTTGQTNQVAAECEAIQHLPRLAEGLLSGDNEDTAAAKMPLEYFKMLKTGEVVSPYNLNQCYKGGPFDLHLNSDIAVSFPVQLERTELNKVGR